MKRRPRLVWIALRRSPRRTSLPVKGPPKGAVRVAQSLPSAPPAGEAGPPDALPPEPVHLTKGEPWWSLVLSYALMTLVGITLVTVAGTPGRLTLPVSAPVFRQQSQSAITRVLEDVSVSALNGRAARDWLTEGAPLVAWVAGRLSPPWTVHWHSLAVTALSDITATPLLTVDALLRDAIPALPVVAPVLTVPSPLPPALTATAPGLPGDHSRIWASLGARPVVGIYQTHSEEAYDTGGTGYSTVWSRTVVQAGWWMAEDLHRDGIPVAQARIDNMREGLLASWSLSAETARQLLRWYPTVRWLIDVHRGASPAGDGLVRIHGHATARIRLVVGTNEMQSNPHWQENLQFALKLVHELAIVAPGILRSSGVQVAPYRYNQELAGTDLLVEIGGPTTRLPAVRRAVADFSEALALLIHAAAEPVG